MIRTARWIVAASLASLIASTAYARDWTQDQFEVTASITENEAKGETSRDYSWGFDGLWTRHGDNEAFSITVDSDYSKVTGGSSSKLDRLKTWFRQIYQNRLATEWNPVITVSTEGNHDFDTLLTLVAGGMRRESRHGFLELTAGASKDVRSAESWAGDIGVLFQHRRNWGRLALTVKPEASYAVLGEFRLSKKSRYTLDVALDYSLGENLGLTYRILRNNFTGDSQRRQYLGLTYRNN